MKSEWSLPARYFTLTLVIIFIVFIGFQIRELLRPLVLAGVISYLLYPFVSFLQQRFRLGRKTASNIVYFTSLAVVIALPVVLVPVLTSQISEITFDLQQTLAQAQQYFARPVSIGGASFDFSGIISQYKDSISNLFSPASQNAIALIRSTSRSTLWGLIVVVSTYFFMTEWENIREALIRTAPEADRRDIRKLYYQIKRVWMAYLRGQLTLMVIVAVTFTVIWTVIGLPGSLYLGLLAGLFSIVPDVGPLAATVLAFAVALLEGSTRLPLNNFMFGLLVIGLYVVLINIKNIWLRPAILGRSVHMHEAIVLVAIVAAVIFTGVLGAFIIVPVLASLGVVWKYLHARILGLPPFQDEESASDPEVATTAAAAGGSRPGPRSTKKKLSK